MQSSAPCGYVSHAQLRKLSWAMKAIGIGGIGKEIIDQKNGKTWENYGALSDSDVLPLFLLAFVEKFLEAPRLVSLFGHISCFSSVLVLSGHISCFSSVLVLCAVGQAALSLVTWRLCAIIVCVCALISNYASLFLKNLEQWVWCRILNNGFDAEAPQLCPTAAAQNGCPKWLPKMRPCVPKLISCWVDLLEGDFPSTISI